MSSIYKVLLSWEVEGEKSNNNKIGAVDITL